MADIVIKIGAQAKEYSAQLKKLRAQTEDLEAGLARAAQISSVAFIALTGSIGAAVKAFSDFETGLIGVGKTTNISGEELQRLGSSIQQISRDIPVATGELLAISQSAGQLGVTGSDNILKFAETIAKLGRASDLQGEQAATILTRILTVTGDGVQEIDKFASVIVRLGNEFAATESEIAFFANRLSATTAAFGLTSTEVAGISTALRSLGINAEAGATVIGQSFQKIDAVIRTGVGPAFQRLEELTGLTGDQLQETFAEDAPKVLELFANGLGRVSDSGGSVTEALAELNIKGVRSNAVFGALSQRSDVLSRALATANDEYEKGGALNEEFARASESLANKFVLLKNNIFIVAQQIGTELAPFVESLIESFTDLVRIFQNPVFASIAKKMLLLGAALTGLIATTTGAGLAFIKLRRALIIANVALKAVGLSVKTLVGATGIGLILIVLSEVVARWETVWPAMLAIFQTFSERIKDIALGLFQILNGTFSFDLTSIKDGIARLKDVLADGFDRIKKDAQETDKAIVESTEEKNERIIASNEERRMTEKEKRFQEALDRLQENEDFQALSKEQQAEFIEENRQQIEESLVTEADARKAALKQQLKDQKDANQRFIREQQKYGKTVASINEVIQSDRVQGAKQASSQLIALQRSENATLKAIGKAAALTDIAIRTAAGAVAAYQSLAPIPFVGPFLGAAAAAALIAFGGEQAGKVIAAQEGGVITGGIPGRDSVPVLAAPGELIAPTRNFDETVNAVADARSRQSDVERDQDQSQTSVVIGFDGPEASQVLTARQVEDRSLGINREAS